MKYLKQVAVEAACQVSGVLRAKEAERSPGVQGTFVGHIFREHL